jgi:hypothetical protein
LGKISQNEKTFMALSDIKDLLSAIWGVTRDRIPVLSNGKIPVEVGSLNVTVGNASLEIANDVGNPVPINDAGGSITVDGTFWQSTQPVSIATSPAGLAYVSSASLTRPANVTAYTANDVYGGVFELQNIGASGGFIFIESLDIIFNITAVPAGMSTFTLYLYGVTPPSAIADNLPFSISSGDRASILNPRGIALSASLAQGGGGSVVAEARNLSQLYKLTGTSLFGYVVTSGAFTPAANSESFTIRVRSFAP